MKSGEISGHPLVSIITPAYNAMPYLEKTIKSVLEQNYPNLEHIVMDGGSKDNSVEVLQSYSHLTWISEKDKGQSHAINKGFAIAKGQIIGWLNADDTYQPDAIWNAVNFFQSNHDYDMVGTDVHIIDENDKVIGRTPSGDLNTVELLSFNPIKQPSVFMRRKVIDRLIGVNEAFHYIMDQEFWLRAGMCHFKFKYLNDKVFANFRLIKGTKTFEMGTQFNEEWNAYTQKILTDPYFDFVSRHKKKSIINANSSKLFLSKMLHSIETADKSKILKYFFLTIKSDSKIIYNSGLWKFLVFGLIGKKVDRFKKFRSNEQNYAKANP